MNRRAKIVATIGPASNSKECLRKLMESGMNVARLNFSHGNLEQHDSNISAIREVAREGGFAIPIVQDLQGPKLRTGVLPPPGKIELEDGQLIELYTGPGDAPEGAVPVDYPSMNRDVKPGNLVLLADGAIELIVEKVENELVKAKVTSGGILGSRKGINVPGVKLSIPTLTEKDIEDLKFGLEREVEAIAVSFVQRAKDIEILRNHITLHNHSERCPWIIAKLEKPAAIDVLDEILEASDGVMVARGDLGVEMSPEKVPSIQKEIIHQANERLKIVITATQMLESMIEHSRPTRAEASDVANAVFDGSDALMLSGETAIGQYPVKTVETMDRIILDAEAHNKRWGYRAADKPIITSDDAVATTHAAQALALDRDVSAIAVFTRSGRTARLMSKIHPQAQILAFTPEETAYRQLGALWGVKPYLVPMARSVEEMIDTIRKAALAHGTIKPGEQIVLVASLPIGAMGPPNFAHLHTIQ
jgi:pyruvate kinase